MHITREDHKNLIIGIMMYALVGQEKKITFIMKEINTSKFIQRLIKKVSEVAYK